MNYPSTSTRDGAQSEPETLDLSKTTSMPQLLVVLHAKLLSITIPLTFEQLQKNENVCLLLISFSLTK
jgi:hypothetical protein